MSIGYSGIATKSGHVNTVNDFYGEHRMHSFALALVSGEERHADPIAANCHLTNRVAMVTSQAVREKGGLRPTAASTIKRGESVLFSDFCGTDLQTLPFSRSPSGNRGWSGGLGGRPALLLQVGPTKPNPARGIPATIT